MMNRLRKNNVLLMFIDMFIIAVCYVAAFFILNYQELYKTAIAKNILLSVFIYEVFLNFFKMYQNMVNYEEGTDYLKYIFCSFLSMGVLTFFGKLLGIFYLDYLRINALASVLTAGCLVGYRLVIREVHIRKNKNTLYRSQQPICNILIVGAGLGGREMILAIKNSSDKKYNIVGVVDDNRLKIKRKILGYDVLGNRFDIPRIVEEYNVDFIFLAIHKIDAIERRKILEICSETNAKIKVWPNAEDLIEKQGAINSLRDVEIEDLLGREPIQLENRNISNLIRNEVVLVTGGGGSIGSEICRQIIQYNPKKLIILDIYENNIYDIEQELKPKYPKEEIVTVVASVRDKARIEDVFRTYRPGIVLHAAAHKHVPLMEESPLEAIHNNIFGTYNVVEMADKYHVKKFVLISTDKAVNPTNIMGATKRFCELIIRSKDKKSKTDFCAVRFGNVLGSNGSVIPLFKKQIAAGGPVTVTDRNITRFFMTIPEAVQLILQAVTYAEGGEIFVLDMGEPVKIYDLAESLIKLMGYVPNEDIEIKITGLRPGEKLYEELLMAEEGLTSTRHEKIFISKPIEVSEGEIKDALDELDSIQYNKNYSIKKVKEIMKEVVPTYHEPTTGGKNEKNR